MSPGRPKYNPKKDGNHTEIVNQLLDLGYDVFDVSGLPAGFDIVVCGVKNVPHCPAPIYCCVRVEIKMPGKKLNKAEVEYWDSQKHGLGFSGVVAETVGEIDDWFGYHPNAKFR